MNKDALILIPSYEPDTLLFNTVKSLYDAGFPILIVNDGSSKEYDDIFNEVKPYATYLENDRNHGKGYTLKHGFSKVKELFPDVRFVITVDGDGQHSIKDIIRLYNELEASNELVFGVRHFHDMPFKSRFGNDFSKISRSLLTKQYVPDDQCGLRGFPVRYIDELLKIKGDKYEYEMNQVVRFQLKQYIIRTITIETIYLDNNSRSHFSPFRDTFRIQSIIFLHAIPALICLGLLIFSMIFIYSKGLRPLSLVSLICYSGITLIYLILLAIIYPTKQFKKRFTRELLYAFIKLIFVDLLLELTVTLLKWPYQVMMPIIIIFSTSLNVLLTWAFRKIYPTSR